MTPADVIDEPAQQQRPERAAEPIARKRNAQRQATPPVNQRAMTAAKLIVVVPAAKMDSAAKRA